MIIVMVLAFLALVAGCNVWYWRQRRGMTQAERAQHDGDVEEQLFIW